MNPYPEKLPPDVAQAQAKFYAQTFRVVLKYPGVVTRVTFWGIGDGNSWLNGWPVPEPHQSPGSSGIENCSPNPPSMP